MAKIHGHGGVLKVGAVDIGHLQGWNLDVQANVTEGSSMGDQWADNEATVKKWSGSAEVYFDPTDAGLNAEASRAQLAAAQNEYAFAKFAAAPSLD